MKDDSLSDVSGYYCSKCKTTGSFNYCIICDDIPDSVGKQEPERTVEAMEQLNVYAKQIWNDALETAANNLTKWYPDNVSTNAFCAAVRSMKK